jgi:hemerythrin superfamily protein
MNAVDFLTGQHRTMESSLKEVAEAAPEEQGAAFKKAADHLVSHVAIEEEIFYPAVKAKRTEDILLESLEEHLSLKRVLADLVCMPLTDPHFGPKLHVLLEQAEHHHKEEEEHLFPKVRKLLGDEELDALGRELAIAQERILRDGGARKRVLGETDAAAPLG